MTDNINPKEENLSGLGTGSSPDTNAPGKRGKKYNSGSHKRKGNGSDQ